jgi:hypothetical protein
LRIGAIDIPCYVLSDESRVVTQQGLIEALGMSRGGAGGKSGSRLANFVSGQALKPYFSETFDSGMTPIRFQTPEGGFAYGYPATVLADICEAVLAARADGSLHHNQQHIAKQCEILLRGFARVGIIALVDEATGYQHYRVRRALEDILERFIHKELLKWAKTFPDEFYEQMFRLKKWEYRQVSSKRPVMAGKLTNNLVYERLAPGVLDELKRITPRDSKGRLKHKYFQRLTEDVGHPRLREHLASVITLMRAFSDWDSFYQALQRALPKQVKMPLFDTDWNQQDSKADGDNPESVDD